MANLLMWMSHYVYIQYIWCVSMERQLSFIHFVNTNLYCTRTPFLFIDNSHESRVKQERDGNFKFQNAFPERNVVIVEKCSCNEDMIQGLGCSCHRSRPLFQNCNA